METMDNRSSFSSRPSKRGSRYMGSRDRRESSHRSSFRHEPYHKDSSRLLNNLCKTYPDKFFSWSLDLNLHLSITKISVDIKYFWLFAYLLLIFQDWIV